MIVSARNRSISFILNLYGLTSSCALLHFFLHCAESITIRFLCNVVGGCHKILPCFNPNKQKRLYLVIQAGKIIARVQSLICKETMTGRTFKVFDKYSI